MTTKRPCTTCNRRTEARSGICTRCRTGREPALTAAFCGWCSQRHSQVDKGLCAVTEKAADHQPGYGDALTGGQWRFDPVARVHRWVRDADAEHDPDLSTAETRAHHAAWERGRRDLLTRRGERQYQRDRKREQRGRGTDAA